MRKIVLSFVTIMLLLTGCSAIKEDTSINDISSSQNEVIEDSNNIEDESMEIVEESEVDIEEGEDVTGF